MAIQATLAAAEDLAEQQLGERIAIARRNIGMSRQDIAQHLGVTRKTVTAWEKGARAPRANQIVMLSGVLNVGTYWLLEGRADEYMETGGDTATILRNQLETARLKLAELTELMNDMEARLENL